MSIFIGIVAFTAGYTASIYTWPWLRRTVIGVEAEVDKLRGQLAKLRHLGT